MKKNYLIVFGAVGIIAMMGLFSACGKKEPIVNEPVLSESVQASPTEETEIASVSGDDSLEIIEDETVRVISMNRPASFGLSKLLKSNDQETSINAYEFLWVDNLGELHNTFMSGNADIAIMPITIGFDLNNAMDNQLQLMAITTLNELYVVENGQAVSDFSSLKGKDLTICGVDMGAGEILNTLAQQNGMKNLDDIKVTWSEDPESTVADLVDGRVSIAVLPEPYATIALEQNKNLRIALDIEEAWAKQNEDQQMPMNAVISTKKFIDENREAVNGFLTEYKQSTQYTLASPEDASDFLVDIGGWELREQIVPVIPRANLVFLTGEEMKAVALPFFQALADHQENPVYQVVPEDSFYYIP